MIFNHRAARFAAAVATAGLAATTFYSTPAVAQEAQASGEVRRVDQAGGKITIKHGAISALQLPAMALVYRASPDLLQDIHPGDKITFTAKRDGDNYVVTEIKR